ncbi:hypothetical protein [Lacrimispora saccharolytica]|uniref:Uncharacterized protein n=1 Tax=Lacrimispora saccharolytica (strain ATCC 35040 / DSM 2544 / NRCC 2533 / WM1) TaxID=610130 RepID=D9R1N0_LACSW|nr:hypothetical protein [Lacrimispora saccharolytica]ADL06553.1 hypothetical protein Closa_4043 [[Clostridium] saccharolyticum WM1]QRV19368.1 hypothetical protein I6K70_18265 [Lacrimispora saccharolytica]
MKKSIMVLLLALTLTVPTITSYAGGWNPFVNSAFEHKKHKVDTNTLPGGKDNPWAEDDFYQFHKYPGRIEGTWQKRQDDYYYVLPDGTDLKNAYVDYRYLSWSGKMSNALEPRAVLALYNYTGGQMPFIDRLGYDGRTYRGGEFACDYITDMYIGKVKSNYPKGDAILSIFAWMDSEMPRLMQLPERDRAIEIAKMVSSKINCEENGTDSYLNTFWFGFENRNIHILLRLFLDRAGLVHNSYELLDLSANNNTFIIETVIDGVKYYTDIKEFQLTGDPKYLLSDSLWPEYVAKQEAYEEARRIEMEKSRRYNAMLDDFHKAHPEYDGGIPIAKLKDDEYMAEYNKAFDEFKAEWERTH